MMAEQDLPGAGYRIQDIYFVEQSYETVDDSDQYEGKEERQLQVLWDWRILEAEDGEPRVVEVLLGLNLLPAEELPDRVTVKVVGRFELYGDQSLDLEHFVSLSGPAALFPYAREKVSSLTSAGPFPAHNLPFVNVVRLMEGMGVEDTTGAEQLRDLDEATDEVVEEEATD